MRSKAGLLLAAVLFLADGRALSAEQERGDSSHLTYAAQLHLANKTKIKTWPGRVLITDVDYLNSRPISEFESTVRFFYTAEPRQLHWEWKVVQSKVASDKAGKYYDQIGILARDRLSTLIVIPGTSPEISVKNVDQLSVGPKSNTFDPMFCLGHSGEDLAERFTFLADNFDAETFKNWTVARENDVVTARYDDGYNAGRYVVDLAKWGTLSQYEASSTNGAPTPIEFVKWNWTYEDIDGAWIPRMLTYEKREQFVIKDGLPVPSSDERIMSRSFSWEESRLNRPIADEEFAFEKLGVREGDTVIDELAGMTYRYGDPVTDPASANNQ